MALKMCVKCVPVFISKPLMWLAVEGNHAGRVALTLKGHLIRQSSTDLE